MGAVLGQLELTLHDKQHELLAQTAVRIGLQGILCRDDAGGIVTLLVGVDITEISTQIVIELCSHILLTDQLVVKLIQPVLGTGPHFRIRIEIHELLIGRDGTIRRRLVQTWFRRTLIERFTHIESSGLGKDATRITGTVFLECLRSNVVILIIILRHRQHIQALLSLIGTLLDGYQFLKQRYGLLELAICKELLGIFVFGLIVAILINSIELRLTTSKQERHT